jgi:hypothetical protein
VGLPKFKRFSIACLIAKALAAGFIGIALSGQ